MNQPLSSVQVLALKKTLKQLNTTEFSSMFYSRLFERHPQVRHLFPESIEDLKTKLMSVFELVVFSFTEKKSGQFLLQDDLLLPLRNLGKLHEDKGVQLAYYSIANGLILETLGHFLKDDFTTEAKTAWQLALNHLTSAMLDSKVVPSASAKSQSGISIREAFGLLMRNIRKPTASN